MTTEKDSKMTRAVELALAAAGGFITAVSAAWGVFEYTVKRPFNERVDEVESELKEAKELAEQNSNRSEQHQFVLFGDPDDPNQTGIAHDVHDIKDTVDRIETKLDDVNGADENSDD